ncbi:MAG TPA: hypothetical protein VFV05_09540 [Methylomirabilota bacterium]|nr:hypothetical protein [Methylomirabilota bacterium]
MRVKIRLRESTSTPYSATTYFLDNCEYEPGTGLVWATGGNPPRRFAVPTSAIAYMEEILESDAPEQGKRRGKAA